MMGKKLNPYQSPIHQNIPKKKKHYSIIANLEKYTEYRTLAPDSLCNIAGKEISRKYQKA